MSVINSFVDEHLVTILPAGSHSVIEIVHTGNGSAIHVLLLSPPFSLVNWVQVRAVGGHANGI